MKRILLPILLLLGIGAHAHDYERSGNAITIHPTQGEARCIRLQVVTDAIIRVEATPDTVLPTKKPSLVVVPQKARPRYQLTTTDSILTIQASQITARVNLHNGRLTFLDPQGTILLQESPQGKHFQRYVSPQTTLPEGYHPTAPDELNWDLYQQDSTADLRTISLNDRTGYTWHTLFEPQPDEAIYGLGQHQSEEMNYTGLNEELFQYNTKVSIPFVLSTRGYGLLWDSYSLGRWGNPHPYQQLPQVFTLYDADRRPGFLTGTYTDAQGHQIVRPEDSIYYENSREIPRLPAGFPLQGSHVVYEGYLQAPTSAHYQFILYYAGYVKVYIDGHLVVPERWRTAWNPNAYKFSVALLRDHLTPIRIEWQPDGDVSYCGLRVAQPQTPHQQQHISIWAEMDRYMDYYVISGPTPDHIISGYRTLTGRAQIPPRWSLGFWQSRERYKTQQEVEETLSEFRQRRIPIDVIVQDWNYWKDDQWGSFQFDPARFPNPQGMYDRVHQLGARLMISCWPKYYCNTDNYKELDRNGWIYRQAVTDSIYDWLGYMGSFYDAYSTGARRMFWRHMSDNLYTPYKMGMDAWWMDASEPNVRDCTPIDYRKLLCGPTARGTSDEYFNSYSLVNADAIYTGQRLTNPYKRVFLLTRSGFAGQQRYSTATWSGDIGTRWEDMRAQMTAGLNFSMAGIPLWGMDQGGFCVESRYVRAQQHFDATGEENDDLREWRELQTRWHQFGCFIPIYRAHGQWPFRELWHIAPPSHPAHESILYYHRLRYHLMPYIYSMAGWLHHSDYTMLRHLAMDFTSDPHVRNIKDQWMFGPSLMACPVGHYQQRERSVYFPANTTWYDLHTGKLTSRGGQMLTVAAPYERIPVYVPAGSILPIGPELQYTDEHPADTISLYVYAGADGHFQLYEDEGTNYNYEKGHYATIDFTYTDATRTLTVSPRRGSFPGMLRQRYFRIVYVTPDAPQALDFNPSQASLITYKGKALTLQL